MKRLSFLLLIASFPLLLSACGPENKQSSYETIDGDRVSTIPWNKPQQWEGAGQLSGLNGGH